MLRTNDQARSTPTGRHRWRRLEGGVALALALVIVSDSAASAHVTGRGRILGEDFGLCVFGEGWMWEGGGTNATFWGQAHAKNSGCRDPWSPYPTPWVQVKVEVYESAVFCGAHQVGNANNASYARWGANPTTWAAYCPGSANWITIDVIGAVFNPNNGGFWRGDYVARPTATHDF